MIYAKDCVEELIDELEIDRKKIRCLSRGEAYAVIWKTLDKFCWFNRDRKITVDDIHTQIKDYLMNTGYVFFRGYTSKDWRNFVNLIFDFFRHNEIVYFCFAEDSEDAVYKGNIDDIAEIIYYGSPITIEGGDFVIVSLNFDLCMVYSGESDYFRFILDKDQGKGDYYDYRCTLYE